VIVKTEKWHQQRKRQWRIVKDKPLQTCRQGLWLKLQLCACTPYIKPQSPTSHNLTSHLFILYLLAHCTVPAFFISLWNSVIWYDNNRILKLTIIGTIITNITLYKHNTQQLHHRHSDSPQNKYSVFKWLVVLPSVLWCCWLGGRKGIWPVKKLEWWGAGMVICLVSG